MAKYYITPMLSMFCVFTTKEDGDADLVAQFEPSYESDAKLFVEDHNRAEAYGEDTEEGDKAH